MNLNRPFAIFALLICVLSGVAYGQDQSYLLGPGDVLEIRVFGQHDLNSTVQVDSDGNLSSLPFLDPIPAKCRTERAVQKEIAAAYARLIKDPQVSVRIVERNSRQPASVSGAVRQGGKIPMERRMRLNELIAASGGFTDKAAGTIQILHTAPLLCPGPGEQVEALPIAGTAIPLQVLKISDLAKGTVNPIIRPGDLVLVTEAEPVYITGSVVSPGGILLRDQLTLSRALGMVGGPRKEANQSEIRIYRQKAGSAAQEIIKVDFEAVKKNQEPDVFLQPYDVIEVSDGFLAGRSWLDILVGVFTGGLRVPVAPAIP
jgi:polysaccharide export outer membrane protein